MKTFLQKRKLKRDLKSFPSPLRKEGERLLEIFTHLSRIPDVVRGTADEGICFYFYPFGLFDPTTYYCFEVFDDLSVVSAWANERNDDAWDLEINPSEEDIYKSIREMEKCLMMNKTSDIFDKIEVSKIYRIWNFFFLKFSTSERRKLLSEVENAETSPQIRLHLCHVYLLPVVNLLMKIPILRKNKILQETLEECNDSIHFLENLSTEELQTLNEQWERVQKIWCE